MKIGHFVHFGIGGADHHALWLVKGLKELGADVQVFYNDMSFPKRSSQWEENTPILSRFENYKDMNPIKIENVSELNDYDISILQTYNSGDAFWVLPGLERLETNFKIVESNFHGEEKTRANVRVMPSQTLKVFKHCNPNVRVIPNAIQPKLTEDSYRKEFNLEDKIVFGKIARPSLDIFSSIPLEAYAKVQNDDTAFIYVGEHKAAYQLVDSLKLKNFTFLPQSVDDYEISKIYNTFDVLCHGNRLGETFVNTIAEAMVHSKPVVSHIGERTYCQAQIEVMGDMMIFISNNQNIDYYAATMKLFMCSNSLYNMWSEYAKIKAKEYNYLNVAAQYLKLYEELA
jgi:hypothetical protein